MTQGYRWEEVWSAADAAAIPHGQHDSQWSMLTFSVERTCSSVTFSTVLFDSRRIMRHSSIILTSSRHEKENINLMQNGLASSLELQRLFE
ncbi:hypothetical protein KIN20_016164 [Parelaphostrongylus tenuis]|uniref:Uncharacterized protein n=1 Tax=Parelaphostrongylus tenuis TaxID=148309 RepID=A0AAD5MG20_PARTN|nr:hypothetical protein KIN20_016164 [Parelaphostrongylus tenuis]